MVRTATVTSGPDCWKGKSGTVLYIDLDWAVVELESRDDCGTGTYNVRLPLSCVKITENPALA